jgi:transcriptional regulator with XRE-family HTH domain
MKDRIKQFLDAKGISPTHFADMLKVQRSGVSHILAGRNKPSYDFITKMLLTFPNISAEWLLLGKGTMYKSPAGGVPQTLSLFEEHPTEGEAATHAEPAEEENANVTADTNAVNPDVAADELTGLRHVAAQKAGKTVERIAIFYADKTFGVYQPE